MATYQPLRVAGTRREIDSATSIIFDVPEPLRQTFAWRPGQHLNLRFELAGEELRRSYSISSSPVEGPLRITVKRVHGGRVSNHLNDHVGAGDTIEAMPPSGGFCLDPKAKARRTHYFFGAGSGITPLFSMLTAVLAAEPHSYVNLLYGNQKAKTIIFREALAQLGKEYSDRLQVVHTLSKPSAWSSFDAWKGIVDRLAVEKFIEWHPPYAQDAHYYVCGPGGMNAAVKVALMGLDVPPERIHMESYGGAIESDTAVAGVAAQARIELDGERIELEVPQGKTVLRALLDAGYQPPYSCEAGVCSTCRAQLSAGTVHLRARAALEDTEIERGAILTCQAIPTASRIALRYE
ncbi:MAG: ferredoxin--NADP reductase [Acidobacteriota bacterium]